MNKILTVICTNHPEYDNFVNENKKLPNNVEDWRFYMGGIYLHGDIEIDNGYDCVSLISGPDFNTYIEEDSLGTRVLRNNYETGIYQCKVHGCDEDCTAFIWSRNIGQYKQYAGLIVKNSDTESFNDAQKKFDEKRSFI